MAHVTVDWNPLGKVFYRKIELYSMAWQEAVDLSKFIVSAASFGGPIALIRDDKHFARVQGSSINKPIIHIFSSAGKELATVKWDGGAIVQMGWSVSEDLLCVADDGSVFVYDIHGAIKKTLTMGQDAKESKVIDCKIYNFAGRTGVAVLTGSYHFYVANNVEEVRSRRIFDPPGLDAPPSSWVIIPHDRGSTLLVAIDHLLYLTDKSQCNKQTVTFKEGPVTSIIEMAISYNYEYLAMFTDTGLLWIGSADLEKVYCEFNTACHSRPKQLAWCATGAVICYWDDYLDVVGPTQDTIRYQMDSSVHLVQELDGVRIIGNEAHELLQRVPAAVEQVFKIGSMEPGAMLFDASKEFEKKSARAEEYIRMIKDRLPEAVQQCIHAAAGEHEPAVQRSLLRAASFGKSFLTDMPPQAFVSMCRTLRVLNAVRDYMVGMPLTYGQLEKLAMKTLIDRLVLRRHYCLAIRICDYLKIPKGEGASRILGHWACYKVQQANVDDEEIARAINSKLGETPGISYSEIASKAVDCGRTQLAIKVGHQGYHVTKNEGWRLVVANMTSFSVYMVVMHLKDNLTLGEFLMAIRHRPVALSLYIKYCKEEDRRTLVDLFYQDDQFLNSGNAYVQDSYSEKTLESKMKTLSKAQMSYQQGNFTFYAKATEEQIKLMEYQVKLEEKYRKSFMDLSLSDTIYQCVLLDDQKVAEQLKKEFKVPDKRFYWLKVRSLAESRNWLELDRFSKARKSLIGYEPFFEACLEFNNRIEAEKYVPRVLPENKVACFVKLGKFEDAAETAFAQKSEEGLDLVLGKCASSNRPLANRIQEMKAHLHQRR
ncbi:vacuolar protein sorting-associated protein 16 homolog [Orbicella faveolata]|uniref:vacuolar protein sorting-associated protein 16 homolog n=1 Tax=Orbicella faveolata TaxID=48498 RepID=UPI0009E397D7|nr:vacuolar protein sorting-associated protein 16 homolog [Orbicella faveolata]